MAKSLIYAELLSNIRQVSVIAALHTPCDATTKAELSKAGQQIVLCHAGETITVDLPEQVSPKARLQAPTPGSKEISWRLPLANVPAAADMESSQDNEVPWSARDLGGGSEFLCPSCESVIIKKGAIKEWRDLPSENWAEMMEFWHCHKPDVPQQERQESANGTSGHEEDFNASRGYGANTKFIARSSIGFVDPTTFLITHQDCSNIQSTDLSNIESNLQTLRLNNYSNQELVRCSTCQAYLGKVDRESKGLKLFKWRLSSLSSKPSLPLFLAYLLAQSFSSSLISRFVLRSTSTPSSSKNISLWVMQHRIRVSSSNIPGHHPGGALKTKLFWDLVDEVAADKLLEREDTDDLLLPAEAIEEILSCLEESAAILPPSAKNFQGWKVGLLERYENQR